MNYALRPSSGASRHLLPQAGEVKYVSALHFSRLREKVDRSASCETDEGLLALNAEFAS